MQTNLSPEYQHTPEGVAAQDLLLNCVHCGFCTATCPTYQLLGDELDGPRGRIYQIKALFEGQTPTRDTQLHLDRCLTCRNCETACPSGMQYGALLDLGRSVVEAKVPRPLREKTLRWLLKTGLNSALFAPALKLGQALRGVLPASLKSHIPAKQEAGTIPNRSHARKVLMLAGCVQPALAPNINAATQRVLDAAGIQTLIAPAAGCCGAVKYHLNDQTGGLAQMRANIDAWWPYIAEQAVEAIVINASGCGVMVKDYGHLLAEDPVYAEKAQRVSALAKDLSELLPDIVAALAAHPNWQNKAAEQALPSLVYHQPCTLQHGQQLRGGVEQQLQALGFTVRVAKLESQMCCGSAGTYSVLQPKLAGELKQRKLKNLDAQDYEMIISANIGCITHLQSGTETPVKHWVEVLDAQIQAT